MKYYIAQNRYNPWPFGGGVPFTDVHKALAFINSDKNQGTDSVLTVEVKK